MTCSSNSFSSSVRLSSRKIWEEYSEETFQGRKRHRVSVAELLPFLFFHCWLWVVVGEKLNEEVVVREPVDEKEEDVCEGEGAAGVEGAVLPGASCHEESSHVDLWPEGGEQEELHCPNQQLWLILPGVVEFPKVLHVDSVLRKNTVFTILTER